MDATKWNETLPCPKCVSDDTDIGWTSRDAIKVTEKIYNDISPGILHDLRPNTRKGGLRSKMILNA